MDIEWQTYVNSAIFISKQLKFRNGKKKENTYKRILIKNTILSNKKNHLFLSFFFSPEIFQGQNKQWNKFVAIIEMYPQISFEMSFFKSLAFY